MLVSEITVMLKWTVGKKIGISLALTLILLMVIPTLSYQNTINSSNSEKWHSQPLKVLAAINNLNWAMQNAEARQRNYLLSGDDADLDTYLADIEQIKQGFTALSTLVINNPTQQISLTQLDILINGIEGKLHKLQETINARQTLGFEAPLKTLSLPEGQQISSKIKNQLTKILDEENRIVAIRADRAAVRIKNTNTIIIFATLLMFILVSCVGYWLWLLRFKIFKDNGSIGEGTDDEILNSNVKFQRDEKEESDLASQFNNQAASIARVTQERQESIELLHSNQQLIKAVYEVQLQMIAGTSSQVFENLLSVLIEFTQSEYALFEELLYGQEAQPFLKTRALIDSTWHESSKSSDSKQLEGELNSDNIKSLMHAVMTSDERIIVNELPSDASGDAKDHTKLTHFLGFPLNVNDESIGVIGLVNRATGYSDEFADFIAPLIQACANVLAFSRSEERANKTEKELGKAKKALEKGSKQLEKKVALHTEKLQDDLVNAEAANVAKSQFLANMSHEVRTPMNGILGMLKLLEQTQLSDQQSNYSQKALGATLSLLRIINDILDFSKIEVGKMSIEESHIRLFDIMSGINNILISSEKNLAQSEIELLFDLDKSTPENLIGDGLRLHQVLLNLTNNAVKFTSKGKVIVATKVIAYNENTLDIEFSVSDTGIGIAADKLVHIFDDYSQAEYSTARRFGGTGLGLAISKKLVELMGGELKVESELEKGSRFFFTLPLALAAEGVSDETEYEENSLSVNDQCLLGMRILLVENDELNQLVAQELLQSYGAEVEIAGEGMEGVRKALDITASFDVILMDMQLPDIDGLEATRRIRDHERMLSTPIIALTGSALASDKVACAEVGMVSHVSKPFDITQLLATILHFVKSPNEELHINPEKTKELDSSLNHSVLDVQWAVTRMGGKSQMYWQVVKHFKLEACQHIHTLQQADLPEVMISMHTLKSISGSVGAFALQYMVSQVERCLQNLQSELRDVSVESALRRGLSRAVEHALNETFFELEKLELQSRKGSDREGMK